MRGDRKGFEGKISRIDLKNYRLYVEGLTREKVDGTTIFISLHPSKVMIKNLNLDDKWRKEAVERKRQLVTKEQEALKKQPPAPEKVKKEKPAEVKEEIEKKPRKPAERLQTAKKVAEKKTPIVKPKESAVVPRERKVVKEKTKTKAPVKKTRAKRKPADEGGV